MSDNPAIDVESADPTKTTSDIIAGSTADEATISMDMMNAKCLWNDTEYDQGTRVTVDGKCYECTFGRWVDIEEG